MYLLQKFMILTVVFFTFTTAVSESRKPKVAVVTGSNKGIGYAIVKGLCEKFNGHVYLTSRDEKRGKQAVHNLNRLGLKPLYHQLDITDLKSIKKFRDYIKAAEGGIDILINNAGVGFFEDKVTPLEKQADTSIQINYFGVLQVTNALSPLLRKNSRVVNTASQLGLLSYIPSKELRSKLSNPTLTINELSALMSNYTASVKHGTQTNDGWPSDGDYSSYTVSKIGVSLLTFIQQRNFDSDPEKRNITVNCVHPGYVDTDMTQHQGVKTPEEGAKPSLYVALENHGLRGKFVMDNFSVYDWYSS